MNLVAEMRSQVALTLAWPEFFQGVSESATIAIDTETNAQDVRDGRGYALGVSLAFHHPTYGVLSRYIAIRHEVGDNEDREVLSQLRRTLEAYTGRAYFHNAKFDLVSLGTLGIRYDGHFVDTMLLAHLINENTPPAKSLDACTKHYLNDTGKEKSEEFTLIQKVNGGPSNPNAWLKMPAGVMASYAAYDADLTLRLGDYLVGLAAAENLMEYWPHKERFTRLIVMMESNGIAIDTDLCRKMANDGADEMQDVLDALGYDNMGPKAYSDLLLERLKLPEITNPKTGRRTFDKSAMARYETILERTDDPTAEYVLAYRGWQKAVSSNYRPYMELLSPDGRLRPNYKLHGTRTGRMSCEKPNLQQIPRVSSKPWNGKLKSAFIPEPGYTLWEADYSQLELRLASAYADDKNLKAVFNEGRDIFTEMSQQLGMSRQDTKTLTYTIQYGGGIKRLVEVFGVTESRARYLMDNFYNTYPGFRHVSNNAKRQVVRHGKVKLWSGRYRHFFFGADEAHKAFNAVMQGGAADVMEHSMLRVADAIGWDNPDCRMLLQVHDSIVLEVKEGLESKYHPLVKEAMEKVEPDFEVRFAVDLHRWGS